VDGRRVLPEAQDHRHAVRHLLRLR
jgi:hypothetical protein